MGIRISYCGDKDYSDIFQKALDQAGLIEIEKGYYKISKTLKIKSDTKLIADKETVIFTSDNSKKYRNDFLLCNDDVEKGNKNIFISGGIWDGNCINNSRGKLFGGGYTGTMINFFNVKNLTIENMILKNPECYYVRLCKVSDFNIRNIVFDSKHIRPNQDGIHIAGYCHKGNIYNLRGTSGNPNDDFVALNADDCLTRLQNLDVLCGEISDIAIYNLQSPFCHSFIRLLSVNSSIKNININNLKGCCKGFAINMDAARYCKRGTRIIKFYEKKYYEGCGNIQNVNIDGIEVYSKKRQKALVLIESNVRNFTIKNYKTDCVYTHTAALSVGYNAPTSVLIKEEDGLSYNKIKGKYKRLRLPARSYKEIKITQIE